MGHKPFEIVDKGPGTIAASYTIAGYRIHSKLTVIESKQMTLDENKLTLVTGTSRDGNYVRAEYEYAEDKIIKVSNEGRESKDKLIQKAKNDIERCIRETENKPRIREKCKDWSL